MQKPIRREEKYSLTTGEPVPIPARKSTLPFTVYGDLPKKTSPYIPSGYMGDGSALKVSSAYESAPLASEAEGRTSLRINYTGKGPQGWAGIYWLTPANNWGTIKGAGFDLTGAKRLTFWIRGEKGGELIAEAAVGGISAGTYPDSDRASIGPLRLSTKWEQYSIDLQDKDLRHIIGGFVFTLRRADNPAGARFYLDEIVYDGVSPAAVAQAPVDVSTAPLEPVRKVIPFAAATTAFTEDSLVILDEVVKIANQNQKNRVTIEGHTDTLGAAAINLKISEERARAVANYLTAHGLSESKISVIGYGEDKPLVADDQNDEAARQTNRRVEIVIAQ